MRSPQAEDVPAVATSVSGKHERMMKPFVAKREQVRQDVADDSATRVGADERFEQNRRRDIGAIRVCSSSQTATLPGLNAVTIMRAGPSAPVRRALPSGRFVFMRTP